MVLVFLADICYYSIFLPSTHTHVSNTTGPMTLFLRFAVAISLVLFIGCGSSRTIVELTDEASVLHQSMLTVDTHVDTPLRLMRGEYNPAVAHDAVSEDGKLDFPRMKQGGLDAVFFAAFIGQGPRTPAGNEAARTTVSAIIDTIHAVLQRNPESAALALTSSDAARIKAEGRRAVYIGIENGYALGRDLSLVKTYYDRGVRYITLCHSYNDDICDSSTDPDTVRYNGLSVFGKQVVREMNDRGMIVDVSHVSDKAFYDVLALSKAPVIASHSCARALCGHPRNMDDAMLTALAERGGVMQLCFVSEYLRTPKPAPEHDSAVTALRAKYDAMGRLTADQRRARKMERKAIDERFPRSMPSVADVVDHIDHVVKVAGIDCVGIGTDFDGGGGVEGCDDVSEMKHITVELLRRGYSHGEIRKIWGGNFLRVFAGVEAYARSRSIQ